MFEYERFEYERFEYERLHVAYKMYRNFIQSKYGIKNNPHWFFNFTRDIRTYALGMERTGQAESMVRVLFAVLSYGIIQLYKSMLLHIYYVYADLAGCSGVGYQPPVVLPTVQRQVAGVRAVIAHVTERNTAR